MAIAENHLIEMLPRVDRLRLLSVCNPVQLVLSEVLFDSAKRTNHVYFPVDGFISLVKPVDGHLGLEVGMVGQEGMVGAQVALGVLQSPLRALVQGSGTARRISTTDFLVVLTESAALQRNVHRYLYVLLEQLATTASCLRFHLLGPRLARWLLMSQDRARTDTFQVTQEFMASMLGVRRVGVTSAAAQLQRAGLIAYRRGEMTVLDRRGLEAAACSCYRADRQTYSDVLGPLRCK